MKRECPICGECITDLDLTEKVPFDCEECGNELIVMKNAEGGLEVVGLIGAMESLLKGPGVTEQIAEKLRVSSILVERAQRVYFQLRDSLLFHQQGSSVEKAMAALTDVMKCTVDLIKLDKKDKYEMNLNTIAQLVHDSAKEHGFHTPEQEIPGIARYVSNLHAEVTELWEAYRHGKLDSPCDKAAEMQSHNLPALTCIEEELADIIIRALDTAKQYQVDIDKAVRAKIEFNRTRPYQHGGKMA